MADTSPARTVMRANVLLASDRNGKKPITVEEISRVFTVVLATVQNIRQQYCEQGLDEVLKRKKRETPPVPAKITREVEARIIALACTNLPQGYCTWPLRLLSSKCVELGFADSLSHVSVQCTLKYEFKLYLKRCWCIPKE